MHPTNNYQPDLLNLCQRMWEFYAPYLDLPLDYEILDHCVEGRLIVLSGNHRWLVSIYQRSFWEVIEPRTRECVVEAFAMSSWESLRRGGGFGFLGNYHTRYWSLYYEVPLPQPFACLDEESG